MTYQELVEYVSGCLNKGYKEKDIVQHLVNNGYDKIICERVVLDAKFGTPMNSESGVISSKKEKPRVSKALAINLSATAILIIVLFGSIIYSGFSLKSLSPLTADQAHKENLNWCVINSNWSNPAVSQGGLTVKNSFKFMGKTLCRASASDNLSTGYAFDKDKTEIWEISQAQNSSDTVYRKIR